jgi:hypothetical protein
MPLDINKYISNTPIYRATQEGRSLQGLMILGVACNATYHQAFIKTNTNRKFHIARNPHTSSLIPNGRCGVR